MKARLDTEILARCLATQKEIILAYLFGSSSRKYQGYGLKHDVDLALLVDERALAKEGWITLKGKLRDEIARAINRNDVDIIFLNTLSLAFRYQVLREGQLLWQTSEEVRVDYETRQILDYVDWVPYEKMFAQSVKDYFLNPS